MSHFVRCLIFGVLISASVPLPAQEFESSNAFEIERLPITNFPNSTSDVALPDDSNPRVASSTGTVYLRPATGEPDWTTPPPPVAATPLWYHPGAWTVFERWDATFELGINGGAGNSESLSMKTGLNIESDANGIIKKLDISYARTSTESLTTQDLFIADLRLEFEFSESPWSVFLSENLTRDKLRPFDWRLTLNGGGGYSFFDNDWTKLKGRFGSGMSREIGGPNDTTVPEGVFGMDFDQKLTKKQKLSAVADYFPDWGNFDEYRLTAKAGWEIVLDERPDLSLKFEVSDRYDSTPNGAKPNDVNYSILLLWTL